MKRFEIDINLEHIKEQRQKWNEAARAFSDAVDTAMIRLIHEGAALRMSHTEVARKSGFTSHQIRARMKAMGLNPSGGKTLLSKQAASVLEHNAEILGIQPHEIDLMSPLAYLPAGPALKHEVSDVHEFPETPLSVGFWCEACGFFEEGNMHMTGGLCDACGCDGNIHVGVEVRKPAQQGEVGA